MAGTANTATGGAPATQIVANPTTGSLPTGDAGIDTLWERPFTDTMTGGWAMTAHQFYLRDDNMPDIARPMAIRCEAAS